MHRSCQVSPIEYHLDDHVRQYRYPIHKTRRLFQCWVGTKLEPFVYKLISVMVSTKSANWYDLRQ
jgi:hypothetical protein